MTTDHTPEDTADKGTPRSDPRRNRRRIGIVAAAGVVAVAIAGTIAAIAIGAATDPATVTATSKPAHDVEVPNLTQEDLDALPAATYNAVIPELLAYKDVDMTSITAAYTAKSGDVPVFGVDQKTPVAKLPAANFLNQPTVIVPVTTSKQWALVLTPARQTKPSQTDGDAAAQTAGWVPLSALEKSATLDATVTVSVSKQTLTIMRGSEKVTYKVGVGTTKTPTPTGTTGYLQARYEDTAQADFPIQLTSLHSAAADDPMGGSDGGLIAAHYNSTNSGAVSHGCIRLTAAALAAVNQLPLGTPVSFAD
ncbi:L,D-transpeptidase family protein [Leifsonia sp. McL0607]|uniref:L,D-transpeptidase n=1 Tax=Leifsonia sp. McL0607 TaxID=3415672 RepID=UPI003CEE487B